MRLARKLFLLAAMALAALAMTATTAGAQGVEVLDEETGEHCDPVVLEAGHVVHGGCHVEFRSTEPIPLVAQTMGGPVTVSICDVHLEGLLDESGEGYITSADLTPVTPPTTPGCTRAPCDEANGNMVPWRAHFEETEAEQNAEVTFCLRVASSPAGTAGTPCEVHVPWVPLAEHNFEIGTHSSHSCENLPPVSITDVHFVNETAPHAGTEDVEIIHTGA